MLKVFAATRHASEALLKLGYILLPFSAASLGTFLTVHKDKHLSAKYCRKGDEIVMRFGLCWSWGEARVQLGKSCAQSLSCAEF